MLNVVLDTNILLVCISSRSRLHWIFQSIINKEFDLSVTTDILSEYSEVIGRHMGPETSESVMGVLENLSNINLLTTYFKFNLLKDPDDNKFVDCAVAANSDFIISHDKDFDILKFISFPKIKVIDSNRFREVLM
jgi:putative PIN family toxin of toxin-antitoxin system